MLVGQTGAYDTELHASWLMRIGKATGNCWPWIVIELEMATGTSRQCPYNTYVPDTSTSILFPTPAAAPAAREPAHGRSGILAIPTAAMPVRDPICGIVRIAGPMYVLAAALCPTARLLRPSIPHAVRGWPPDLDLQVSCVEEATDPVRIPALTDTHLWHRRENWALWAGAARRLRAPVGLPTH